MICIHLLLAQSPSESLEEEVVGQAEFEIEVYPKPFIPYEYLPLLEVRLFLREIGREDALYLLDTLYTNLVYPKDSVLARRKLERLEGLPEGTKELILSALLFQAKAYASSYALAFHTSNNTDVPTVKRLATKIYMTSALMEENYEVAYITANSYGELFEDEDPLAYWVSSESAYYMKNYEDAERKASQIYDSQREISSRAYYISGWVSMHFGKYREALNQLLNAYERTSNEQLKHVLKVGQAVCYFNLGNRRRALEIVEGASEANIPHDALSELLYYRGLIYFYNRQDDKALRDFSRFIQEYPSDKRSAYIALRLADLYRFQGNIKDAIANLEWIVSNFGSIQEKELALYLLGELYFSREEYEQALYKYMHLIDEFPTSEYISTAKLRAEQILTKLATDDEKYVRMFEKYFPNSEKLADVYYYWGGYYFERKDYERSADYFYRLALKFPEHPKASESLFTAGQLYMKLKRWGEAVEVFKRLVELYPTYEKVGEAYANIGLSYLNMGEVGSAVKFLESALNEKAHLLNDYYKGLMYMYLGLAYERFGFLDKARYYLENARTFFFGVGRIDKVEEVNSYLDKLPR